MNFIIIVNVGVDICHDVRYSVRNGYELLCSWKILYSWSFYSVKRFTMDNFYRSFGNLRMVDDLLGHVKCNRVWHFCIMGTLQVVCKKYVIVDLIGTFQKKKTLSAGDSMSNQSNCSCITVFCHSFILSEWPVISTAIDFC